MGGAGSSTRRSTTRLRPGGSWGTAPDSQQSCRLASPRVSAGFLSRLQCSQNAIPQVPWGPFEGARHALPNLRGRQEIALHGVVAAGAISREGDALRAGVNRHPPLSVDEGHLADVTSRIDGKKLLESCGSGLAGFPDRQTAGPVSGMD